MDGHADEGAGEDGLQSSLPESLIPHLYRHPPLRQYDPEAPAPILPPLDPPPLPPLSTAPYTLADQRWLEGEAGPSSRYRRSLSPRFDPFGRPAANYDYPDLRDSFLLPPPQPLHPYHHPDIDSSYPPLAALSIHTPPPQRSDGYRSDSFHDDQVSPHPHQLPKRNRPQDNDHPSPRKNATPRKTAVACNFCRSRKLRCDGARPKCHTCSGRQIVCEYVPIPKRRGPGKAPKGSRSKKADTDPSVSAPPADRPSASTSTFELAPQAPETHFPTLDVFPLNYEPRLPAPPASSRPPIKRSRRDPSEDRDRSGAERD